MACSGGREANFAWFFGVFGAAPLMRVVLPLPLADRRRGGLFKTCMGLLLV
jgi:hypothetical protein